MFPNGASSPKSPLQDEKASLARREGYFTLGLPSDPFILTPCARHPHVPQLQGYPGWVAVFHQGDLRGCPRHTGGSQRHLPAEFRAQGTLPAEAAHSPGRKGRAEGLGLPQLPSPLPATAYQQPRFPPVPVQPSQGANQTPLFTCSPHATAYGFPCRNVGWLTEALVLSA